ncbi:MAG: lamin tail domain-containing protein [Minisyncoccia bacterium]|jgi:hypothetical protein
MLDFKKIFFFFFFLSNLVFASDLYISEIMYNPEGSDEGREWVEVVNLSSVSIKIFGGKKGWRFNDGSNHLFEETEVILNPNEVLIIAQNKQKFLSEYPSFRGKIIEVKNMSLRNEKGIISIFDENKNLRAYREYSNTCGGNGNSYSIIFINNICYENSQKGGNPGVYPDERKLEIKEKIEEDVKEKNASQNNEEKISLKSLSAEISTSSLLSTSTMSEEDFSCLVINEFLPNPDGRDENREFIELYNECDKKLNLDGLTLKVGRFKLKLSGEIKEKEFKVLRNSDYRFYIRNSGEEISLLKDKETLYKISYSGKAPEGLSFSRNEEEWFWTLPTPGRENEKESYQENNLKVEELKEERKINRISKEEIKTDDFDELLSNEGKAKIYSSEPKIIQIFLPLAFITLIALVFTILFKI